MPKLVPVSSSRHASKQLLPATSFAAYANQTVVSLLAAEFAAAALHLPTVFVKIEEKYNSAALLGLTPESNVMIDAEGRWLGGYLPASLRRQPFVLARKDENSTDFALCVDEESELLADKGGEALFTAEGKSTPTLINAQKFSEEYLKNSIASDKLTARLVELELLAPLNIKDKDGKVLRYDGVMIVDEKKFNALSDEAFLELRGLGALPVIYAHLFSLKQLDRLIVSK